MRITFVMLIVLVGGGVALAEVPDGFEIVEIVNHNEHKRVRDINNCGVVAFQQARRNEFVLIEVFTYDNGFIKRISFSDGKSSQLPVINDFGIMAWTGNKVDRFDQRMIIWQDGVAIDLGRGRVPSINNLAHLTYFEPYGWDSCFETYLRFYDGETVETIDTPERSNQGDSLNDRDEFAWTQYDFCQNPWESIILLQLDESTLTLTDGQFQPQHPSLNDSRQVAWSTAQGTELWEDGETVSISPLRYRSPTMNNSGDMTVTKWDDDLEKRDLWYYQVSQGEPTFYQLTDDDLSESDSPINDWGEIVYDSYDPRTGNSVAISLMRRIRTGDSEFDGDIDIDDLAKLVDCMTGPMWVERTDPWPADSLCDCRFLDINHDGSVDLRDYALFQENYAK